MPLPSPSLGKRFHAFLMSRLSPGYERRVGAKKHRLFAELRGRVLEIGPGTGANFRHFSPDITWIGAEPNPFMHPYLEREAERRGFSAGRLELHDWPAERLGLPDGSVDAVVATLVLCSVDDLDRALSEVHRVLRPGGRFLFVEHVAAPRGTWLRRFQGAIRPVWTRLADGCHPDRETAEAIERAGFDDVELERFRLPLGPAAPQILGSAVRA